MSDIIVTIPDSNNIIPESAPASSVVVTFPASNRVVTTVIDRGVLYGIQGVNGVGVPSGGSTGQVLKKASGNNYDTTWADDNNSVTSVNGKTGVVVLVKADVGLGNVDNTSDLNKPISTATQTALNAKQDSIGYTPADAARTLTINDVTYDLTANRTWTVGDLVSTGSYSNPSWLTALAWGKITGTPTTIAGYGITDGISTGGSYANPTWLTSLAWGKITSTPTTLSGYGITDGVSTSGSYSNPSWITDLAFSKITGYSVPTLAQVTTAGATTTNAITVGGLTSSGNILVSTGYSYNVGSSSAPFANIYSVNYLSPASFTISAGGIAGMVLYQNTRNLVLQNGGTFTDAGYRLDVNGTTRFQGASTFTGSVTAASAIARGTYLNQTLVASANNDVLVGLDIAPTFTNGSFTGVTNYALRVTGNIVLPASASIYVGYNSNGSTSEAILFGGGRAYIGFDTSIGGTTIGAVSTRSISFGLGNSGATTVYGRFHSTTGNFTLQNGGTFTDAGYRLDVNGTARIQNVLTLGSLSADPTGANGMIYYNTTLGMFRVYQSGAWKTVTAV